MERRDPRRGRRVLFHALGAATRVLVPPLPTYSSNYLGAVAAGRPRDWVRFWWPSDEHGSKIIGGATRFSRDRD